MSRFGVLYNRVITDKQKVTNKRKATDIPVLDSAKRRRKEKTRDQLLIENIVETLHIELGDLESWWGLTVYCYEEGYDYYALHGKGRFPGLLPKYYISGESVQAPTNVCACCEVHEIPYSDPRSFVGMLCRPFCIEAGDIKLKPYLGMSLLDFQFWVRELYMSMQGRVRQLDQMLALLEIVKRMCMSFCFDCIDKPRLPQRRIAVPVVDLLRRLLELL